MAELGSAGDGLHFASPSSHSHLLILTVALAIGYWTCNTIYLVYFHPLARYPGPRLWAASQIPHALAYTSGDGHHRIARLHKQYGAIVRVAPNRLSLNAPESWNEVMGHSKGSIEENGKAPHYYIEGNRYVIGADRENHGRQRRLLSHGFSAQAIKEQQVVLQEYVNLLMQQIREQGEGGSKPVDMVMWLNYTTFDIVGDLAFGEPFGSLRGGSYHPWVSLIFDNIKIAAQGYALAQFPLLAKVMRFFAPRELMKQVAEHDKMTRTLVDRRLASDTARLDLMHAMTRKYESMSLSQDELYANSSILVVAGSETTASALSGQLFYLCKTPAALQRLASEIRTVFKSEDEINILSVQNLPYLDACIHEGLRLFPAVPSSNPRVTPKGGNIIFGDHVPEGTILDIWMWPMFNNPNYFKDAHMFIPERWLGDAQYKDDRRDAVQAFSYGPRNCVGKNLAYAEMRIIMSRLLWNFDIRLAEGSDNWAAGQKVYILWDKPPLNLHLTPVSRD